MAGSSLLALLDDIATVLDDVAVMAKVAAKKTAGVVGDDLALNAKQLVGLRAERELPVVWAVAKGSFKNKLILVPAALLIGTFTPWLIAPLLIIGGAYLCFEGVEKLWHAYHTSEAEEARHIQELEQALVDPAVDMEVFEKEKIKGAIRTDFVLSAEIIVITLGSVAAATFTHQVVIVAGIALVMTVGVYGFVALIVKLDDMGVHLTEKKQGAGLAAQQLLGRILLAAAPKLMKFLSVVGTLAMFMVGGGILSHNIEPIHHAVTALIAPMSSWPLGTWWQLGASSLLDALVGVAIGAVIVVAVVQFGKLRKK